MFINLINALYIHISNDSENYYQQKKLRFRNLSSNIENALVFVISKDKEPFLEMSELYFSR